MTSERKRSHLNQSGKIWDKNDSIAEDGLVTSLTNYRANEHIWKVDRVCVHNTTGCAASADERGQVYVYSAAQNTYSSVRLASTPVSAIEFIHCRKARLIVAYTHGTICIVDTEERTVVGHLQLARPAVITRICCHPTKPIAALVSADGTVSLWDLRTLLCTKTLDAQEEIVDLEYSMEGSLLVIVYQNIGAVYYHCNDGKPELKCSLPENERQPRWLAYCSSLNRDRILMSADNGLLYIFDGQMGVSVSGAAFADRLMYENDDKHVRGICPLLSVAEIPVQYGNVICMKALESAAPAGTPSPLFTHNRTVALLTSKGHVLLLNITEERGKPSGKKRYGGGVLPTQWVWRVTADISLSGKPVEKSVGEHSFMTQTLTPSLRNGGGSSSLPQSKDSLTPHRSSVYALTGRDRMCVMGNAHYRKGAGPELVGHLTSLRDRDIEASTEEYFMSFVICDNGSLNIFDWGAIISEDNTRRANGEAVGLLLRHRGSGQTGLDMKDPTTSSSPFHKASHSSPHKINSSHKSGVRKNMSPFLGPDENTIANITLKSAASAVKKLQSPSVAKTRSNIDKAHAAKDSSVLSSFSKQQKSNRHNTHSSHDTDELETVPLHTTSTSIFDLSMASSQSDKGSKMTKAKLSFFLEKNGKYPDEYRPLIWRFLLQLPENSLAFADLVKRSTHPAFNSRSLGRKYPLESSRLFSKLQSLCSQLGHWATIFGEAPYIPQLCFPFLLVFESDELAALETVMSLLMWWGYAWHICHPNPPAHLTDSFDALLLHFDPNLHKHLRSLEVSPGLIGWRLTYSMYSEFLSKETWLRVMDFIFTHFQSMELMLLIPVALIRLSGPSLLCAHSSEHILRYFSVQQDFKAASIVSMVQHMMVKAPKNLLLACYRGAASRAHDTFTHEDVAARQEQHVKRSRHNMSGLPGASNRAPKRLDPSKLAGSGDNLEAEMAAWRASPTEAVRQSLAAEAGTPVFPLPRGRYPAYDGYPKAMVDWELRKRSVQMTLDEELECREDVLHELEKRISELDDDHEVWMANHKAATESEVRSRYELMEREKDHMRQLAVMEDLISRKRLSALTSLEKVSKQELQMLDEASAETKKMLAAGEDHLRSKMDASVMVQRHREAGEAAEAIISDRLHRLYVDRARDERMKALAETLQRAEGDMNARTAQLNSELQHLEQVAKTKRNARLVRSKEVAEQETTSRLRNSMLDRLTQLTVDRENQLAVLEREAALKSLREEAREAEESIRRSQILYEKQEENLSKEVAARLAIDALQASKQKLADIMIEIKEQSEILLEQERVAALKEGQSKVRSRGYDVAVSQAGSLQEQMQDALYAQIEAQNELSRLKSLAIASERGIQSVERASRAGKLGSSSIRQEEDWANGSGYHDHAAEERMQHQAKSSTMNTKSALRAAVDSDTSTSISSTDIHSSTKGPKKRRFAAVDALLGGSDEDIMIGAKLASRDKPATQLVYMEEDDSSDPEQPLPSESVLSPQGAAGAGTRDARDRFEGEAALTTSTAFMMRASANKEWSSGEDIQFPASGRLKQKIQSGSSPSDPSSSDAARYSSSATRSSENNITTTKTTTTTRREVRWQEEAENEQAVGRVSDVVQAKWTGFSYADADDDSDGEDDAMRRLAEKNLHVLVRLRADERQGGDTVDQDVRDLLQNDDTVSDHSDSQVSGDVAEGDDADSALWNMRKYAY